MSRKEHFPILTGCQKGRTLEKHADLFVNPVSIIWDMPTFLIINGDGPARVLLPRMHQHNRLTHAGAADHDNRFLF